MRGMLGGWGAIGAILLAIPLPVHSDELWTPKHEKGRCAIRGHCGSEGFFSPQLPCPDNGLATTPAADVRTKLISICGDQWSDSDVCCNGEQLDALEKNLKRAEGIISGCPACKENFFNMFCTFTCSPDQSLFINVTQTKAKGAKSVVTELDHLVSNTYGSVFYDSCKDAKFGATNGNVMDFIGGGAKNYTAFLKFLGDKKFLGSPFQMNFPRPSASPFKGMDPMDKKVWPCNTTNENYRCACVDCAGSCPTLPDAIESHQCYVGLLPCLSFAVIIVYSVFLGLLIIAISGHVAYQRRMRHKSERLRLLQDLDTSDDEDEGDMVHNVGMLDRPTTHYPLNTYCDRAFTQLGRTCARFPAITISVSVLLVGLLSLGWIRFAVETDPARLWVAPNSAAAQEKDFFDTNFGPFYRAQQAFLVNDTLPSGPGPILSYDTLSWWFDVENRVQRLKSQKRGITLDDVCFKPTGEACVTQSITGYFQGDFANLDPNDWQSQVDNCVETPTTPGCLPEFQQPLDPNMILGGWNHSALDSQALIVTWVVNNHAEGTAELEDAMDWESSLKGLLLAVQGEAKERGLRLSFNTEISLEEELNKSTNTDAKIVVVSYIIMFIYASLALGSTTLTAVSILRNPANALVQSKFMLGIVGILIVLMSVSASVGLFSAAGIKGTLIIAEVIPFLVLAVGVDNIFLIVHEFERVNISHPEGAVSERVAKTLGRMGPSILLSAVTETIAFSLGGAVGMPAVRNFAAYAAGAVLINALLQITMFISVLALNQRRVEDGRADCFPCHKVRRADPTASGSMIFGADEEGALQRFIRKTYAPALLGKKTKVAIVTIFLGIFTAGLALLPAVELGLDQRIAIPSDSYLIQYFDDLYDYFNAGPPVYFVTRELNVSQRLHQQELCGRFPTCQEFSIANVIEQERKRSETSYIASTAASWIDDYFLWLQPTQTKCCIDVDKNGVERPCFERRDPPWNRTLSGMPQGDEFISYLSRWIESPTTEDCPLGGKAPYSNALVINKEQSTIPASHFRTFHTPLKSQHDFIAAYTSARHIAATLSEHLSVSVFPYSKFYIFFDQYTSIVRLSAALIGSAIAIIFVVTSVLLGSIQTALVVALTVTMVIIDILGTMAIVNVSLNAVSLVNLIISVGISVEFCAHIARAFTYPSRSVMERAPKHRFRGKDARAWTAIVNVGGSVFSGITVTKFLGVCVLAFTRSKIFEIYYFRVWLALIIWAASHALIFLPVALSLFGGKGYIDPESEGGLEEDLRSRRYPSLLAEEEYDSDI